jgi:hypothetical protein
VEDDEGEEKGHQDQAEADAEKSVAAEVAPVQDDPRQDEQKRGVHLDFDAPHTPDNQRSAHFPPRLSVPAPIVAPAINSGGPWDIPGLRYGYLYRTSELLIRCHCTPCGMCGKEPEQKQHHPHATAVLSEHSVEQVGKMVNKRPKCQAAGD